VNPEVAQFVLDEGHLDAIRRVVGSNSPRGFRVFYALIHDKVLPRHASQWIEDVYLARAMGKGAVAYAFRGGLKTNTFTNTFVPYQVGIHPERANLVVQSKEAQAFDNSQKVAGIVHSNAGWKLCFPHLVRDKVRGWGARGYNVKRNDLSYEEWTRHLPGKDPTFVALGEQSADVLGMHPDGTFVGDDINNEMNTSSPKELRRVNKMVEGTIFPGFVPTTWPIFVGTPWVHGDVLDYVSSLEQDFVTLRTPIVDDAGISIWPEKFPQSEIARLRRRGAIEFARMYLLDLTAAQGHVLKRDWLHYMAWEDIRPEWPLYIGVDYAEAFDAKSGEHDYFSVTWGRGMPGGTVIEDGYRDQLSRGEAEERLLSLAGSMPNYKTIGIEMAGGGQAWLHSLMRHTGLRITPVPVGSKRGDDRLQLEMAPWFEFAQVWLSNKETEWMQTFVSEWLGHPYADHDDTLFSTYAMLYAARSHLRPIKNTDSLSPFARGTPVGRESIWKDLVRA
jgi:hypothetical protein